MVRAWAGWAGGIPSSLLCLPDLRLGLSCRPCSRGLVLEGMCGQSPGGGPQGGWGASPETSSPVGTPPRPVRATLRCLSPAEWGQGGTGREEAPWGAQPQGGASRPEGLGRSADSSWKDPDQQGKAPGQKVKNAACCLQ